MTMMTQTKTSPKFPFKGKPNNLKNFLESVDVKPRTSIFLDQLSST